jgi:hypothetical protein
MCELLISLLACPLLLVLRGAPACYCCLLTPPRRLAAEQLN